MSEILEKVIADPEVARKNYLRQIKEFEQLKNDVVVAAQAYNESLAGKREKLESAIQAIREDIKSRDADITSAEGLMVKATLEDDLKAIKAQEETIAKLKSERSSLEGRVDFLKRAAEEATGDDKLYDKAIALHQKLLEKKRELGEGMSSVKGTLNDLIKIWTALEEKYSWYAIRGTYTADTAIDKMNAIHNKTNKAV